jgi:hypothetical protein
MRRSLALSLVPALVLAGCTAAAAGASNFTLKPDRIGWFAGDEAHFFLNLTSSVFHAHPSFAIDRQFAIEEMQFNERGLKFGGDYSTKDPDAVSLRLERNGTQADSFVMDDAHPSVDVYVKVPGTLRDSEYDFELKLFDVGWVKSDSFRVDTR